MLAAHASLRAIDGSPDMDDELSADSPTVETAMATTKIKSEPDDVDDDDESTKPAYMSSVSFVNLVESIFVKKEDLKPIENIEPVTSNMKEERLDPISMSEEIPFLTMERNSECEFLINPTADGIEANSDWKFLQFSSDFDEFIFISNLSVRVFIHVLFFFFSSFLLFSFKLCVSLYVHQTSNKNTIIRQACSTKT